jgi:hypothetical protein
MADWKSLPDHSRVWVYQCERKLSTTESTWLKEQASHFVDTWSSHGTPLQAAVELFDDLFLVVFVDEQHATASGCSIDKSVGFIKMLENELKISLMDRMMTAILTESGPEPVDLKTFPALKQEGKIAENTVVFDHLVSTKADFLRSWKKPITESWHVRFLN